MPNKRKTGTAWEERAASYLTKKGVRILERNFRCRFGEIDLIGRDNGTLVFIEVKYRSGPGRGFPEEAVGVRKQRTICRVADFYRMKNRIPEDAAIRFDVVAIDEEIRHRKAAFPYLF